MSRQQRSKKASAAGRGTRMVLVRYFLCVCVCVCVAAAGQKCIRSNSFLLAKKQPSKLPVSKTSLQHSSPTVLYNTLPQHFSTKLYPNTPLANSCLQHSSPTLLPDISLQHFFQTFSIQNYSALQHFFSTLP